MKTNDDIGSIDRPVRFPARGEVGYKANGMWIIRSASARRSRRGTYPWRYVDDKALVAERDGEAKR